MIKPFGFLRDYAWGFVFIIKNVLENTCVEYFGGLPRVYPEIRKWHKNRKA